MPRKKETNKQRAERKKKEYIMALLRTVSGVFTMIIATLSFGVSILIFVKIYLNGN